MSMKENEGAHMIVYTVYGLASHLSPFLIFTLLILSFSLPFLILAGLNGAR